MLSGERAIHKRTVTIADCRDNNYIYIVECFIHAFIHFWHAPLLVRSAKCRHHSPEWTILCHVNCFVQGEVHGFQVLLGSLHPCSTRASRWSPPVL